MPITPMTSNHLASQLGTFEPQRRNHYQIRFFLGNFLDEEMLTLGIVGGFMPSEGNEEIQIPHKNEDVWVAGRRTLESGTIRVRDYVDRETLAAILRWRQQVYNPLTGGVGFASLYKKSGEILLTAPDGISNERIWQLIGCWPTQANPGELADDQNDVVVADVTIRFDKAIPLFAISAESSLAASIPSVAGGLV